MLPEILGSFSIASECLVLGPNTLTPVPSRLLNPSVNYMILLRCMMQMFSPLKYRLSINTINLEYLLKTKLSDHGVYSELTDWLDLSDTFDLSKLTPTVFLEQSSLTSSTLPLATSSTWRCRGVRFSKTSKFHPTCYTYACQSLYFVECPLDSD